MNLAEHPTSAFAVGFEHRRFFHLGGIGGLCILALALCGRAEQAAKHPNVLLITTDQQQVTATSAAGNPLLKTPHMDSIAGPAR